jgi:hypothetical protein
VANTTFRDNSALLRGGGLAWSCRPRLESVTYSNNRAVYGSDVASFGVKLVLNDTSRPSKTLSHSYVNLASGQRLPEPIVVALVDHEGLVVSTDNSSIGQIYGADTTSTAVIGQSRVSAQQGTYTFNQVIIIADPGSTIKLTFTSDAVNAAALSDELLLEVSLRPCKSGEASIEGLGCVSCPSGTYSLDPSEACKECPDEATCYGGNLMVPKAEYWRFSRTSANFYKCLNPPACLGSPFIVPALTGVCARGYQGNLCHSCESGFSRGSLNTCAECPDQATNALRLIGLSLAVCLACGVLVWSSLRTVYKPQSLQAVYLKIFAGYLQLITLTTQLDLDWPRFVKNYFEVQEYQTSIEKQVFSVDCYLAARQDSTDTSYFDKLLILTLVPVLLGTAACAFWAVVFYFKRKKRLFKIQLVATLVVLFFLVHPSLVKEFFNAFNCTQIEGQLWLISDLSIKCFNERHLTFTLIVALPAILVWGIGVPSFILGFLIKRRSTLHRVSMRGRFGFFYNGFKSTHFYWEFLILYRKIIIIFVVVFLGSESVSVQALSLMLVLLIFLFLQYSQNPYTYEKLNQMELRGILVASITINCGLYYLTKDLGEEAKVVLLVVMVLANCSFLYSFLQHFTNSLMQSLANSFRFLRRFYPAVDPFTSVPASHSPLTKSVYTKLNNPSKVLTLSRMSAAPSVAGSDLATLDIESFYKSCMETFQNAASSR